MLLYNKQIHLEKQKKNPQRTTNITLHSLHQDAVYQSSKYTILKLE